MSDDAYGDFRDDTGPGSNINAVLNQLADELIAAQEEVERIEQELVVAKNLVKDITEKRIPAVTDGLEGKFNLGNDRILEIKEDIRASVAGEKLGPAVEWLTEHKFDSIVKRSLGFEFGKNDHKKVAEFKKVMEPIIKELGLVMKEKNAIHPQTLLAWVKERLKEGDEIPADTFGVFRQKSAKVKEG